MQDDDIRFDSIEGSEEDQLDAATANGADDSIRSGGDPDDNNQTQDVDYPLSS